MLTDEQPLTDDERPLSEDEKPRTIVGLTRLVAEGKAHVRPSYHEVTAIGITLVILILGYVWGMYTDPLNFTRSGELIVITGIIFAGLDLTGRLSLVDEWMVARLERIRPVIVPGWGKKGQEQAQEKLERREILEGNVTSGVKEATDKARVRLRFIEISILILGSLICGFGDLVVVSWRP
jgi:hypothetical protein